MRRMSLVVPVVVSAALLSACGGGAPSAAPATSAAPTAAASRAPATATRHASATPRATAAPTHNSAAAATGGDVDCGPITAANGQRMKVIAKASSAGVAGCTEAIDVLTAYFTRAAAESQGTAHELTVQGWQCSTLDAASVPGGLVGCEKQGLTIRAAS